MPEPTAHEYLDLAARAFARGAETQCTASLLAGMCLSTARRHVAGRAAGSDLEAARKAAGQVLAMDDRRVPSGIAEAVCLCVLAIEATNYHVADMLAQCEEDEDMALAQDADGYNAAKARRKGCM